MKKSDGKIKISVEKEGAPSQSGDVSAQVSEAPHELTVPPSAEADRASGAEAAPEHNASEEVIAILEKERDEFKDKFLRTYADLENFRKRVAREKEDLIKYGAEKLLKEILGIKDHLDRALDFEGQADVEQLREGLNLIKKEFNRFMQSAQVETVATVGQAFDPQVHEALTEEESDAAPGTVIAEYQTGYLLHGRLLRPARVAVAKAKTPRSQDT